MQSRPLTEYRIIRNKNQMNLEIYLKKKKKNQVIRYFSPYCFKCMSLSPAGSAVKNPPAIKETQETWV